MRPIASPDGYIAPTGLPFRKGSLAWKVAMEPAIAAGGGRALLLQVLHPAVAAGVEQYSNFEQDPFRRGFRTADVMLKLAFADEKTSRRQAQLLRRMHERVQGTTPDGMAYRALDPQLLLWVWATLVDVSLIMYERAVAPLSEFERERYYQEQKLIAYASGVPEGGCPPTHADFRLYVERMVDEELEVTKVARVVAFAGRHPPLPWPLGPLAGRLVSLFTAGLLPERFRDDLGYRWSAGRQRMLDALLLASRVLTRLVPGPLRRLPNHYLIRRKTPLGLWSNRRVRLPEELAG